MDEKQFEACIQEMLRGERQGLKQVYETYVGYIYTIVYGILQSKENAEDVTSDFFIKLWEKADYYKPGNGHKAYLAAMARNMSVDYLRKHKKEQLTAVFQTDDLRDKDEEEPVHKNRYSREDNSVENEVLEELSLQEAMRQLKPSERQIIDMKVLGGLPFREIAKLLAIPMGTVTWRYQNAIKRLRRWGYE